jgi:hypothetical protein
VNSFTTGYQGVPAVASDAAGNFVVAWQGSGQDDYGVFAQRYDSAGTAQGGEFRVNTYTTSYQTLPSVGATGDNQFVVAWDSHEQDGSDFGIFGQRLDFGGTPTIHAGDLDGRATDFDARWRAQVRTRVHDSSHGPVGGALVMLDVPGVGTRSCTTTASGVCTVSVVVRDTVPSLTITVTSLSKAGFSYQAPANHDPDGDSNGTVIVVNQP